MKHRSHLTTGPPRFLAMRITEEQDKLGTKDHATCRSGVGTLLYLTKHSMPDLCNAVRDLSKTLDKPAPIHSKEMYRINRYVLPTKRQRLRFAYSDSDYASDKETRRRVYGYFVYSCGVPIMWRSKGMRTVVLSTTEAKYIALSEMVKELKSTIKVLQTMKIEVKIPITVFVGNVRAI